MLFASVTGEEKRPARFLPPRPPSAAAFAQLATELIRTAANDPTPHAWHPGDFFSTRFSSEKKNKVSLNLPNGLAL